MSQPPPRLYAIADLEYAGNEATWLTWLQRLGQAAAHGELPAPIAIQARARQLSGSALEAAAARARAAMGDVPLAVLNAPAPLAAQLGYQGAHWPESQIPPAPLPYPRLAFMSAAAHSIAAVRRAERAGADAVLFAPVFQPSWKRGNVAGLEALRAIAAATPLPVYALGGVTVERTPACLDHGAYGVAVVSGVFGADDPAAAARYYLEALAAGERHQPDAPATA